MMKRHAFERTALGAEGKHHGFRALYLRYLAARGKESCEGTSLTIDSTAWETIMFLILEEQQSER
jgi:hypothetical protein